MTRLMRKQDLVMVAENTAIANTFWTRLKGLIGKKEFHFGEGLLFPDNNSIHMWMMNRPIDVVFLKETISEKEWSVLQVHRSLKPWKLLPVMCFKADDTLELPAGTIDRVQLKTGEVLCIV